MEESKKVHFLYSAADFLNSQGHFSDASIFSRIKLSTRHSYIDSDVELKIKDCQNQINLAFGFEDEGYMANNLHKLKVMIEHLKKFQDNLVLAYEEYMKQSIILEKEREETEKKRKLINNGSR